MTVLALSQLLPYPGQASWKSLRYLGRELRSVPATPVAAIRARLTGAICPPGTPAR